MDEADRDRDFACIPVDFCRQLFREIHGNTGIPSYTCGMAAIHANIMRLCTHAVRKRVATGLILVAYGVWPSLAGADFIIDDFTGTGSGSPWPMTVNAQTSHQIGFEDGAPGVFGGGRQSGLFWSNMSPPGTSITASILTDLGVLDYRAFGGAAGDLELVYGANVVMDFSTEIGIQIDFNVLNLPSGPLTLSIGVWDGTPGEQGTAGVRLALDESGQQSLRLAFADFLGDPLNWATIQLLVIQIDARDGVDFQIGQISTFVPAPGILLCFVVAAIGNRHRRR